jgi:hypothetical protein
MRSAVPTDSNNNVVAAELKINTVLIFVTKVELCNYLIGLKPFLTSTRLRDDIANADRAIGKVGEELAIEAMRDIEKLTEVIHNIDSNPKNWIVSEIKKRKIIMKLRGSN